MPLPTDPAILLSFINTHLRDTYSSLEELCHSMDIDQSALEHSLAAIDYCYDPSHNQFV